MTPAAEAQGAPSSTSSTGDRALDKALCLLPAAAPLHFSGASQTNHHVLHLHDPHLAAGSRQLWLQGGGHGCMGSNACRVPFCMTPTWAAALLHLWLWREGHGCTGKSAYARCQLTLLCSMHAYGGRRARAVVTGRVQQLASSLKEAAASMGGAWSYGRAISWAERMRSKFVSCFNSLKQLPPPVVWGG